MKANVIYSNTPIKSKLSVGSVYKSQDSDTTFVLLKVVSMKDLTFEVLSIDEDGDIATFNLTETAKKLNKRNDALENEISEISALLNEKVDTIIKRDNEIDALKQMLDRKDEEQ